MDHYNCLKMPFLLNVKKNLERTLKFLVTWFNVTNTGFYMVSSVGGGVDYFVLN